MRILDWGITESSIGFIFDIKYHEGIDYEGREILFTGLHLKFLVIQVTIGWGI